MRSKTQFVFYNTRIASRCFHTKMLLNTFNNFTLREFAAKERPAARCQSGFVVRSLSSHSTAISNEHQPEKKNVSISPSFASRESYCRREMKLAGRRNDAITPSASLLSSSSSLLSSDFRRFSSNHHGAEMKNLRRVGVPHALKDEEEDEDYEEDDDIEDESFYVGDVECIADVSFVSDVDGNGDVKLIAKKMNMDEGKLESMREGLEKDARAILKLFVDANGEESSDSDGDVYNRLRENLGDDFPEQLSHAELSVALCDDAYIQTLNNEWRSKDAPTDVLSFPSGGEEEGIAAFGPICVLGDIIISLETARAQAEEVGHSVEDELRVLLAHGFAHLLGFDHELGEEEEKDMKELEREIMEALGWDYIKDGGLIDRASSSSSASSSEVSKKVLVVDLDGTLLNESSRVSDRVAKALLEASKDESTLIVIATGKARPAAKAALATNPLLKNSRIVSESSPGIFLNGGASYGENGVPLIDDALPVECVRKAFEQNYGEEFALTAFTSDDRCLTLRASPFLDELHERYHEPKSEILASVDEIVAQSRGQVKKMLLIGPNKDAIDEYLSEFSKLFIDTGNGALVTRAVATMLEVVPENVDKSRAVSALLDSLVLASDNSRNNNYRLVVVGDGDNDTGMIKFAASMRKEGVEGVGVAMGNASPSSRNAASVILNETNADDGVAVAIERFIL